MTSKQVFIISNYAMFGHGLESLLRQEDELEIVGQETDLERALRQIKETEPDVVILDNDSPSYDSLPVVLHHILEENLETQVIGLSLSNNRLHVYVATQSVVSDVTDLMQAILHDSSPSTLH